MRALILFIVLLFTSTNVYSSNNNEHPIASSSSDNSNNDEQPFVIEIVEDDSDDEEIDNITLKIYSHIIENKEKLAQKELMKNFTSIDIGYFSLLIGTARDNNMFDLLRLLNNLYISRFIKDQKNKAFENILKGDFSALLGIINKSNKSDIKIFFNKQCTDMDLKVLPFTAAINNTSMFECLLLQMLLHDPQFEYIDQYDINSILAFTEPYQNIDILKMLENIIKIKIMTEKRSNSVYHMKFLEIKMLEAQLKKTYTLMERLKKS